jgi:hypothetical protein
MINPDFLIEKEVFLRKDLCSKDFLISGATLDLRNEWPFIPDKVVRKVIEVDETDNTFRTDDGYWLSVTKIESFVKSSINVTLEEEFLLLI